MKKIAGILVLVMVLMMLAGCGSKDENTGVAKTETYTCRDLTMTVPAGMADLSGRVSFEAFTFTLDSADLAIFGLHDSFADFPEVEAYTLEEYTELVIQGNGLDSVPATREGKDYIYFTYTYQADGAEHKYLTGLFRSSEGFWMVQITAPADAYDEAACFGYLDSVKFE